MHTLPIQSLPIQSNKYFYNQRLITVVILTFINGCPAWAQLPPTNMGQFVHQPGDNQYTAQTQLDRHHMSMPVPAGPVTQPAAAPIVTDYKPTPAAPRADISLLPIVADEPLKPAGFPPLPDRLDLPVNSSGLWAGNNGGTAGGNVITSSRYVSSSPSGVHEHYVHYQPGAFIPPQELQQTTYRPATADYYNINPAARPVALNYAMPSPAVPTIPTPATQRLQHLSAEPQLAPDAVSKPEVPSAVTVNQSVSQDLSLPEDDFNKHYPTPIGNTPANRTASGVGHVLAYPLKSLGYTATGMIMGAAGSAAGMSGMYMHR